MPKAIAIDELREIRNTGTYQLIMVNVETTEPINIIPNYWKEAIKD